MNPGSHGPLLRIEDLHVEIAGRSRTGGPRTVHALDGISLDLAPGEALGLVGESGCGKTMTALSVLGLLPGGGRITGGSIRFGGRDLATASEPVLREIRGHTIGMVFQDPLTSLNPTMTIGAQVAEPLLLHKGMRRAEAWRRAEEMLGLVGMPRPAERLKNYPHQLSGGMRQRVAIAMALVCEPDLLIADEPTTALDVTTQAQILELVDDLRGRLGMAMILVTHDLGVIARRVDRVAVMYAGRIAERAAVRTLFTTPRHRYTQALFAALPERATDTTQPLATIPGLPPSLAVRPAGCRFAPRCRFATDRCRQIEPELEPDGGGGDGEGDQAFACFHPVPPGVDVVAEVVPAEPPAGPPVREDETLLQLGEVAKDYPLHGGPFARRGGAAAVSAVAGVSLTVRRGETFGIVGESGCGKSTLGRLVVGMEKPTGGSIRFAGRDISALDRRAHRREVQLMFQDSYASMDPRMRVGTILREPLVIQGIGDRAGQDARIAELLDDVGLPRGAVDRYPHEFSGGQRQRLGLARALALSPDLVVADEPVSALDVSVQAQILNLMRDLQREKGLTYLFISHDLAVVRYLADTVGVMYLGKLVETGPAERVFAAPLHPYTRGLLDTAEAGAADAAVADRADRADRAGRTDRADGTAGTDAGPGRAGTAGGAPLGGEAPSAAAPPSGCRFRTRCPLAQDICAEHEPPPAEPRTPGHRVACHFPLVVAPTA